ncbi:MAG TPA: methyltransferase domain-containing protein [Candidatus Dormibacteraeota bacterium]|nr:methyltransferase domain-containing protein [Candidatus Dormibacteraeota bacterium]
MAPRSRDAAGLQGTVGTRGSVECLALTAPGLGPLLREELWERAGAEQVGRVENDGRSDVVPFSIPAGRSLPRLRLAEEVLAQVGWARGELPLPCLVARLWDDARFLRTLTALPSRRRGRSHTFRVVTRLTSERRFLRTQFRDRLVGAILRSRPRWRQADPARFELWALQTGRATYRLGLRLDEGPGARPVERPGALRPALAAALVRLAGQPGRPLLDPCCGSGTVVGEALAVGLKAIGADRSWDGIWAARLNLPARTCLVAADATHLPFPRHALGAVVTNLPFGRRYRVAGEHAAWLARAFAEFLRVVEPGGRIVLLHPHSSAFELGVLSEHRGRLRWRRPVALLGLPATIWVFDTPGPLDRG